MYRALFRQTSEDRLVGRVRLVAVLGDPEVLRPVQLRHEREQGVDVPPSGSCGCSCPFGNIGAPRCRRPRTDGARRRQSCSCRTASAAVRNERIKPTARFVPGASLPFGPLTPQATFSPTGLPLSGRDEHGVDAGVDGVQIFAYWYALSIRHVRPTFLYCSMSQMRSRLVGFHAVHRVTSGSGRVVVAVPTDPAATSAARSSRCSGCPPPARSPEENPAPSSAERSWPGHRSPTRA